MSPQSGRRYRMRLEFNDEHAVAQLLVILAAKERGINLVQCAWSERESLAQRGVEFAVPGEWAEAAGVPHAGVFTCTYISEKPSYIDENARRALAERFCAWEPLDRNS